MADDYVEGIDNFDVQNFFGYLMMMVDLLSEYNSVHQLWILCTYANGSPERHLHLYFKIW